MRTMGWEERIELKPDVLAGKVRLEAVYREVDLANTWMKQGFDPCLVQ